MRIRRPGSFCFDSAVSRICGRWCRSRAAGPTCRGRYVPYALAERRKRGAAGGNGVLCQTERNGTSASYRHAGLPDRPCSSAGDTRNAPHLTVGAARWELFTFELGGVSLVPMGHYRPSVNHGRYRLRWLTWRPRGLDLYRLNGAGGVTHRSRMGRY
jgi:hypothetical protein